MKRCPECRRDYYDDTLLYCLDDGDLSVPPAVAGGSIRPVDHNDEPQTENLPAQSDQEFESRTALRQPRATAGGSDR